MSIGPIEKPQLKMTNRMERVTLEIKKVTNAYFEDPWHYLFYTGVLYTFISLMFKHSPIWQFYLFLVITGFIKLYKNFRTQKSLIEEENKNAN